MIGKQGALEIYGPNPGIMRRCRDREVETLSREELEQHRRRSRQVEWRFEGGLGGEGKGLGVAWAVAC